MYGDNAKTAAGVTGGSFMHVQQAMVDVVGNGLRNANIILKKRVDPFSGAVSDNMELKRRLTHNIISGMIINAQDGLTNNIVLELKSLCSTSHV
jgi:hypothetical protein